VAAQGCGQFVLGRSTRSEILPNSSAEDRYSKTGLFFEFDNHDHLSAVVVTSPAFSDDAGLRVGDPEPNVIQRRGQPGLEQWGLLKSETVIGSVGDHVLIYPGVEFVIYENKVWAIRIMRH